jgi:hypothetical protein
MVLPAEGKASALMGFARKCERTGCGRVGRSSKEFDTSACAGGMMLEVDTSACAGGLMIEVDTSACAGGMPMSEWLPSIALPLLASREMVQELVAPLLAPLELVQDPCAMCCCLLLASKECLAV